MTGVIRLLSKSDVFRKDLDYHLVRASMVFIFAIFGYQKWFPFEAETIEPLIAHSPLVFWLNPGFRRSRRELVFRNHRVHVRFAAFSRILEQATRHTWRRGFTVHLRFNYHNHPFLPEAWSPQAGGFPAMTLVTGFLLKDVVLLTASFYLLKQDIVRAPNYKDTASSAYRKT
jgi:uncharacterized membrane protein YkgB